MIKYFLVLGIVIPAALFAEGGQDTLSQQNPIVTATVPAVIFDAAAQTNLITQAVKNYYGINGHLELSAVGDMAPLSATPTAVDLLEIPESPSSTMIIHARYLKDNQKIGEVTAAFHAQWKVPVFVSKAPIARGSALNPADFETQMLDRLNIHQVIVEPNVKFADYELLGVLPADTPLTWNYLRAQPLIHKGAMVDVVAQEDGLKVSTRALATQDAGRGEQLIMRNPISNRQFEAYVINENLVQIHF